MNPLRDVSKDRAPASALTTRLALAALLSLGALSTPARADARAIERAPVLESGIRGSVHAGDAIELKWDGSDPAIDELEIELSVDGGRHFALRVSPELDTRAGHFVWRVPNLASADARLRMRYHRDGREVEGGIGAAFRITPNSGATPEFAQVHEGAWWNGTRDAESAAAPGALASSEPAWSAGGAASADGIQARGLSLRAPVAAPCIGRARATTVAPAAASRETPAPRLIAQRN